METNKKLYTREDNYIYFGLYPQGTNGEIEPIKWRILSEENGEALLLSEYILDAHRFDEESNNYKDSEIRKWLNNDFYNKAFNDNEKQIILTIEYTCGNMQDKVFLLSVREVTNPKYGFNEDIDYCDNQRVKKPTAYAIKQGVDTFIENGCWWLRSRCIGYIHDYRGFCVDSFGDFIHADVFFDTGIAPAIKIKI